MTFSQYKNQIASAILDISQNLLSCMFYHDEKSTPINNSMNYESIEYTFFSLDIINKNIHENILEILDQNHISIKVTFLYFSTNQVETQNKNILENPDQKLINRKYLGSKINK